jgi:hypothetical protein
MPSPCSRPDQIDLYEHIDDSCLLLAECCPVKVTFGSAAV